MKAGNDRVQVAPLGADRARRVLLGNALDDRYDPNNEKIVVFYDNAIV